MDISILASPGVLVTNVGQSSLEDGVISIKHDVSWMLDFEATEDLM